MTDFSSLLRVVQFCDNAPYTVADTKTYSFESHDGYLLGRIPIGNVEKLRDADFLHVDDSRQLVKIIDPDNLDNKFANLTSGWRKNDTFEVLKGWRDELYSCYTVNGAVYFRIERSAACIFGLVTYGVHITGYCVKDGEMHIWVPRRSYSKPTYPGKLDNTVAGGLGNSLGFFETAVKECSEEAGLDPEFTSEALKQTGVVTYEFIDPQTGYWQPEVEIVYDMELPPSITPAPNDGEVAEFRLMSVPQVIKLIGAGEFKYNCALILADFFCRHSICTFENTPGYIEIVQRCHRHLPYPLKSL